MNRPMLNASDATWLANTLARNKERFGGWSMVADPEGGESLGEGGKKALEAERAARKAAEDEMKALRGEGGRSELQRERDARKQAESDLATLRKDFDTFRTTLAEATGIKPAKGDDGADTLKQVQDTLAQIQHENVVLALANEHKITAPDDLAILRGSSANAEGLAALAQRLAPSEDLRTPGTPKPDKTQGSKGEPPSPAVPAGVPRMAAALEEQLSNT